MFRYTASSARPPRGQMNTFMENAFFRYKSIIGESLRARSRAEQETEALLACNILNQMTQLGRPASYAIGR